MSNNKYFFAVDLGATSGRTIIGRINGDKFDLRKGQRIALAKAETAAYGDIVREVKDTLAGLEKGISQAQDFLAKAARVKEGNAKYIQRVDSGEIK